MDSQNDQYVQANTKNKNDQEIRSNSKNEKKSQDEIKKDRKERGRQLAEIHRKRKEEGTLKQSQSKSKKSGVLFPVSKIVKNLKKMYRDKIVSEQAGIYLASVLEYLCSEVLDISGELANKLKKKRIIPHYILLAIDGDAELKQLLKDVIISEGGVTPHVHPELLKTKSRKRTTSQEDEETEQPKKRAKKSISKKDKNISKGEEVEQTEEEQEEQRDKAEYEKEQLKKSISNREENEDFTTKRVEPESSTQEIPPFQANVPSEIPTSQEKESENEEEIEKGQAKEKQPIIQIQKLAEKPSKKKDDKQNKLKTSIEAEKEDESKKSLLISESDESSTVDLSELSEEEPVAKDQELNRSPESTQPRTEQEQIEISEILNHFEIPVNIEEASRLKQSDSSFLNLESYFNIKASSSKLIEEIITGRRSENNNSVLRNIDNNVYVLNKPIIPNVIFDKSISKKKDNRKKNHEI